MSQPLYNEQDNADLNTKINEVIKNVAQESVKKEIAARGQTSVINHADEQGFFKEPTSKNSIEVNTVDGPQNIPLAAIRRAQAQLGENGGAVVVGGGNDSSQMFDNIKNMFSTNKNVEFKIERNFVSGHGKAKVAIDRTIFAPSSVTMLSGRRFEQKYLEQLESYVFNDKDELNPDNLFALIFMSNLIKEKKAPIQLITGRYQRQLSKIVSAMNQFYSKNKTVLDGIATMFNGMTVVQPNKVEQKAE